MKQILMIAAVIAATAAVAQSEPATGAKAASAKDAAPPPDVSKMTLSQASIRRIMGYHQPKIQECYETFLAGQQKPVDGKLITSFVITAEGAVEKPAVVKKGTTLRDPTLHECVVSALSAIEFPKPKDGTPQPVEYPFNLKSVK
ncbi:MAG TPA: AgmX/PglI C-terminal domain-containing protein [Myxococcaceae bacterium]|nr:AgmX/PglI C-terminal domain-containing protein [Myxococcaceae bacterium]